MRDGGRKNFAGDRTGVPTTEWEVHEIRNIERIDFRHRSMDQTRIRVHVRFTAWNKFNRDSHVVEPKTFRIPSDVVLTRENGLFRNGATGKSRFRSKGKV